MHSIAQYSHLILQSWSK